MSAGELFRFPNPVNEVSARLVAGAVAVTAWVTLGTRWPWLLPAVAYGFIARVLTGPTLSPLGQTVTRLVTPRLPVRPKLIPGPPKRFAQGIGAVFSTTATVLWLGFGIEPAGLALVGLLGVAASLESVFAICLGCRIFDILMRVGVIPATVCEACNNLALARSRT
ncbi:MAG TPA: DUF4395 domain-containing protein [Candidatus Binatia bacterium]|nr:DUF4395 domain-containing protein [Candidatus Binatia bacterium]